MRVHKTRASRNSYKRVVLGIRGLWQQIPRVVRATCGAVAVVAACSGCELFRSPAPPTPPQVQQDVAEGKGARELASENRKLLEELRGRGIDVRYSERGIVVNLPDVLFASNRSELTPYARETVKEIAQVLNGAPSRKISVEGHTDAQGDLNHNYKLSDARARSVQRELERNQIASDRLSIRAFGETEPITTNRTEEGRRRNRRVEIIIEN